MITLIDSPLLPRAMTFEDIAIFSEVSRRLSSMTQVDCCLFQSYCRHRDGIDALIMYTRTDETFYKT